MLRVFLQVREGTGGETQHLRDIVSACSHDLQ